MKRLLTVLYLFPLVAAAQDSYSLGPESQPQDGVPKGAVTRHVLPPGKFYPGTPHNYAIYLPAKVDATQPAPFMIFLDGSGSLSNNVRVPVVFDNLIAKGDLPPLIGIFVDPGVLPAAEGMQSRFERVFEYDSLSDRFANFLIEELIPAVAKSHKLSADPNARAIAGVSTGAVGAFAAAWNRPDQFRRVLSFIGTFVAMKGADSLPALIRRTETKPLRVFLQAGKNDHVTPNQPYGTFYAGSWPINNQLMFEALQFAGYQARLELGVEGHNMKHGAAILPEALRWLWRGYPHEPIAVNEPEALNQPGWDPRGRVSATVSAGQPWQTIGGFEGAGLLSSPTADNQGNVFFADASARRIYKADPAGSVTIFRDQTGGASAIRMGPGLRLYVADPSRGRIVSYDAATGRDEKLVANLGKAQIGDLAVTAGGEIYFSDTSTQTIGYLNPSTGSRARTVYAANSAAEILAPQGIALSPDQAMLIVTDARSRHSWSFQIDPAGSGSLINGEPFYRLEIPETAGAAAGARGVTLDSIGQVYFATPLGIQVCEANGRVAMILNPPGGAAGQGGVSALTFAARELKMLYATQGKHVFGRPTKVQGVAPWAPAKLPRPPL